MRDIFCIILIFVFQKRKKGRVFVSFSLREVKGAPQSCAMPISKISNLKNVLFLYIKYIFYSHRYADDHKHS